MEKRYFNPDLPAELIERILIDSESPEDIHDVVRLCTLNRKYAKRCYEKDFWFRYLEAMNYSQKDYVYLLAIIANIGNEELFFYLLDQEYIQLSPNMYRNLIESVAATGNADIFFRLIRNPAPGHITEAVALSDAYEAAMYYEFDDISDKYLLDQDLKNMRDTLQVRKDPHLKQKAIIRKAHSLMAKKKVNIESLNELFIGRRKDLVIHDIFAYGGRYEQLVEILNQLNSEVVEKEHIDIDRTVRSIIYIILYTRYGNIPFLKDLINRKYDFFGNIEMSWIISSKNHAAQELLMEHLKLWDRVWTPNSIVNNALTNELILRQLLENYPNAPLTREILFNNFGVLDDDEYLTIVDSYQPSEDEASTLYHLSYDFGYDYIANYVKRNYKFRVDRE